MAKMFCGLDFGTSNSSVALAGESGVRILYLDFVNDNPASLPSLLYISRDGEHIVGRAAANALHRQALAGKPQPGPTRPWPVE